MERGVERERGEIEVGRGEGRKDGLRGDGRREDRG